MGTKRLNANNVCGTCLAGIVEHLYDEESEKHAITTFAAAIAVMSAKHKDGEIILLLQEILEINAKAKKATGWKIS
jgi:hypothetical protein